MSTGGGGLTNLLADMIMRSDSSVKSNTPGSKPEYHLGGGKRN